MRTLFLLLLLTFSGISQDDKKNSFGFEFGLNDQVVTIPSDFDDNSILSRSAKNNVISTRFNFGLSENLIMETSIGYFNHNTEIERFNNTSGRTLAVNSSFNVFVFGVNFVSNYIFTEDEQLRGFIRFGIDKQVAAETGVIEDYENTLFFHDEEMLTFQEDLLSPLRFNIGFGAEYFINEKFGFTSALKIGYNIVKSEVKPSSIETGSIVKDDKITIKHNWMSVNFSIGVNYYF